MTTNRRPAARFGNRRACGEIARRLVIAAVSSIETADVPPAECRREARPSPPGGESAFSSPIRSSCGANRSRPSAKAHPPAEREGRRFPLGRHARTRFAAAPTGGRAPDEG